MNILLCVILLVIVLILGVLTSILYKITRKSAAVESKSLEDMASIMRAEHEEKERAKRDQDLIDYARSKMANVPPRMPMTSNEQGDRPVRVGSQKKELVPFNMTELEKRIWEEFNS